MGQGRLGRSIEGVVHDDRDLGFLAKVILLIENRWVVVIEAYDHPRHDEQVVRLDGVDCLDEVEFLVLGFVRLSQARLARRLDTDEDLVEIGVMQQAQQFLIPDHVNAGLRIKCQRRILAGVPSGQGL